MNFVKTFIDGIYIIEPKIFEDARGFFYEGYNKRIFDQEGLNYNFVQDNISKSSYGTIRGLHFQKGEFAQAKLIRVLVGHIIDVAVDLRLNSPTYGKYIEVELSDKNHKQLLIPRGFAHGFSVISNEAIINYKVDNFYSKDHEDGIRFDDPDLNINWRIAKDKAIISDKDKKYFCFKEFKSCF